jgi:predicted phosphate transport protein (TIGR00153 family)
MVVAPNPEHRRKFPVCRDSLRRRIMFSKFFKRETEFGHFMLCYADNIEKSSEQFAAFIRVFDPKKVDDWIKQIKELEHACDVNTHQAMNWLESTFIVNFDREDIHRLASDLDDIVDFMDAAATRISLYNVTEILPDIVKLADVLSLACKETAKAIRAISGPKLNRQILDICKNIKNYEEEGDTIYHRVLASLFKGDKNPLDVIKFKEIIEEIERSLDKCNQTAMNVESIIFKYT